MEYGVHLPLIDFEGRGFTFESLLSYTAEAERLGYTQISANDHLVYLHPWLDGPTALAAVMHKTGAMTLSTSVTLVAVRRPVVVAKMLGAISLLSGGRLIASVGPGSLQLDYQGMDVPYEERWKRLDDGIRMLRALWAGDEYAGKFYSTLGVPMEPRPPLTPIWIGSWGSDAGLRRVARLGDGWMASAYNTTPERFAAAMAQLNGLLTAAGKDASSFPNTLATMWCYITEDRAETDTVLRDVIAKVVRHPQEQLRERLLVGSAEEAARKVRAFAEAGVQRLLIWPVRDEIRQIETFMSKVLPLVVS